MSEQPTSIADQEQGPALIPFNAYAIRQKKSEQELAAWEARSRIDVPTGLINKAAFEGIVEDRIAAAEIPNDAERPILAAMIIDTTGFKEVNDQLGHDTGDQFLTDLADSLPRWFRPEDAITLLGRVGGDELAVLLDLKPREVYEAEHRQKAEATQEYSDQQRLAAVIDRFEECKEAFFADQKEDIKRLHEQRIVDLAVGAALWQPGWDSKRLFKEADDLMYEMKRRQHAQRDQLKNESLSDFQKQIKESAKRMLREAGLDDEADRLG